MNNNMHYENEMFQRLYRDLNLPIGRSVLGWILERRLTDCVIRTQLNVLSKINVNHQHRHQEIDKYKYDIIGRISQKHLWYHDGDIMEMGQQRLQYYYTQ